MPFVNMGRIISSFSICMAFISFSFFFCLDFYVFLVSFCSEGEFDGLGEGDRRSHSSREVKNVNSGPFLVVQWLRICLAMQRMWV